jgi:TATA-box binding protein (TBP) (component of TFIID and TFIIIB)
MNRVNNININNNSNIVFPDYEKTKVSTKTIIAMINATFNTKKLYDILPITNYVVIPKRRGRKKKIEYIDPNKDIPCGSIITLKLVNDVRGVDLNKKQIKVNNDNGIKTPSSKYFRNSLTIVMVIEGKNINSKVSRNGKFQLTGCKNDEQAEKFLKYFWNYIYELNNIDNTPIYIMNKTCNEKENKNIEIIFIPAMRNIDFDLGFCVDREKLSNYINENTEYNSWIESAFGYTGVNIKFQLNDDLSLLDLKKITYENNNWSESILSYYDYIDLLPTKEQDKKLKKKYHNTFLVFHSGKTIMSGMTSEFMKEHYYEFINIIKNCYNEIIEKLD